MTGKIKLIFFHPYSYIGGADNSLRRLIENLIKIMSFDMMLRLRWTTMD